MKFFVSGCYMVLASETWHREINTLYLRSVAVD